MRQELVLYITQIALDPPAPQQIPLSGLIEKAGGTVDLINVDDRLTFQILVRKADISKTLFTTSCGASSKANSKAIPVLTEKNNLPAHCVSYESR